MDYNIGIVEQKEKEKRIAAIIVAVSLFLLIVGVLGSLLWLQAEKTEYAYTLSALINVQEEVLQGYGAFPETLGLQDLRDAWVKDPCYETAEAYSQALEEALEKFDKSSDAKLMA